MKKVEIPYIDYDQLGRRLCDLRQSDQRMLRYVCFCRYQEMKEDPAKWDAAPEHCTRDGACEDCLRPVEREVSQSELARVLGVTKTMVGNWEQGRTSPDLEYLLMYSRISGIDLEKLLF